MKTRWLVALTWVAALTLATSSRGDVLPFAPRQQFGIMLFFEGMGQDPGFEFYVQSRMRTEKVGLDRTVHLHQWARGPGPIYLVAVPGAQKMPELVNVFDEDDWVAKGPPGALRSAPLPGAHGPISDEDSGGTAHYRVRIQNDQLVVELIDFEPPPSQAWFWWSLGGCVATPFVLLACAVAILVFILSRRSKPITAPPA